LSPATPGQNHSFADSEINPNAASPRAATGEERKTENEGHAVAVTLMRSQKHPLGFEPLIGSLEAAKLLGNIHVKTLQRYARHRRIPGYQIGGHWYFRASELDSWLRSQINSKCQSVR
jgi:excisionase family DNA binding protein